MKKRIVSLVLVIAIIASIMCVLVSCGTSVKVDESKKIVEFTAEKSLITKYECKTLQNYMDALQKENKFTYKATGSGDMTFVTTINNLQADSTKEYWAIYSNSKSEKNFSYAKTEWGGPYEYNKVEYGYANFGIYSLPIEEGIVYLFVLTAF